MTREEEIAIEALRREEVEHAVAPYEGKVPAFMMAKLRELADRYYREHPQARQALEILAHDQRVRSGADAKGAGTGDGEAVAGVKKEG